MQARAFLREILKPRSYQAAKDLREGNYDTALYEVVLATLLRSGVAYLGIRAIGFTPSESVKASLSGNIAITSSVMGYYLLEENL